MKWERKKRKGGITYLLILGKVFCGENLCDDPHTIFHSNLAESRNCVEARLLPTGGHDMKTEPIDFTVIQSHTH